RPVPPGARPQGGAVLAAALPGHDHLPAARLVAPGVPADDAGEGDMSHDERALRAAIEAAPDDEAPHKVFADWLDEHDRPEEADWHRLWTPKAGRAARAWFRTFAAAHSDDLGGGGPPYTAEDM